MTTFEKIAGLLESKGLRSADLSRATGISSSRLTQLSQDNGKLRVHELLRIARALDVSMEFLADPEATDPEPSLTVGEKAILMFVRSMGEAEAIRRLSVQIFGASGQSSSRTGTIK